MVKDKKPPMARPPKTVDTVDLAALDQFASGASKPPQEPAPTVDQSYIASEAAKKEPTPPKEKPATKHRTEKALPWQSTDVNEKVLVPFNLRLTQPNSLKIKYIVNHSAGYKSAHDFAMKAVLEKVERELKKIL